MKSYKSLIVIILTILTIGLSNILNAQTTTRIKKIYPIVTISPFGGAILPIGILADNFKPGGNVGLDVGYRINKEVGLYAKFGYYFMNSKITGAPVGNYLEFTGGPRYFFTKPNLKSSLFVETGVGGYNFNQKSFVNPADTIGAVVNQINDLRPGVNAGIGANLAISNAIDILLKTKYNLIFTPNGSNSFITAVAGLEFKIR